MNNVASHAKCLTFSFPVFPETVLPYVSEYNNCFSVSVCVSRIAADRHAFKTHNKALCGKSGERLRVNHRAKNGTQSHDQTWAKQWIAEWKQKCKQKHMNKEQCMHTCTHTHACTHTCTCTCIYRSQNWLYLAPIQGMSQQQPQNWWSRLQCRHQPISPQLHAPLRAVKYSSMGLQDPWDEGGGVRPWVNASEYPSWTLGRKITHLYALVIFKWLACAVPTVLNTIDRFVALARTLKQ